MCLFPTFLRGVLVISHLAVCAIVFPDETPPRSNQFESPDPKARLSAKANAFQIRKSIIRDAQLVLEQSDGPFHIDDYRLTAIQVLAEYKAESSVEQLIKLIEHENDFVVTNSESEEPPIAETYPTAGALAKLGKPAAAGCLWELTKDISKLRRDNLCWVIGNVEGPELGRYAIDLAAAQQSDIIKATRLRVAAQVFAGKFPVRTPAPGVTGKPKP